MAASERSRMPGTGFVPAIEVIGLTLTFGGLNAVDDLSFSVAPGSIKGIIGTNGAGKTTLFNAISGPKLQSRRQVTLMGKDLTVMEPPGSTGNGTSRPLHTL